MDVTVITPSRRRRGIATVLAALAATAFALSLVGTASAYSARSSGVPGAILLAPRVHAWGENMLADQLPGVYLPSMHVGRSPAAPSASQYICVAPKLWDYSPIYDFTVVADWGGPDCAWVRPGYMLMSDPQTETDLAAPQAYEVTWVVTWRTSTQLIGRKMLSYDNPRDYLCTSGYGCGMKRVPRLNGYVLMLS